MLVSPFEHFGSISLNSRGPVGRVLGASLNGRTLSLLSVAVTDKPLSLTHSGVIDVAMFYSTLVKPFQKVLWAYMVPSSAFCRAEKRLVACWFFVA